VASLSNPFKKWFRISNERSDDTSGPISLHHPLSIFIESTLVKILVQRQSKSHTVLSYLRMKRGKPVSAQQIFDFSPKKFEYLNLVHRSLDRLVTHGFAQEKDGCYTITPQGVSYLVHITATQPKYQYE
jgi:hypothetical protein